MENKNNKKEKKSKNKINSLKCIDHLFINMEHTIIIYLKMKMKQKKVSNYYKRIQNKIIII